MENFVGAAGAWVSTSRILSKLICNDEKDGTVVFFGITIFTLIICWILYAMVKKTAFIEFYITLCQESRKKIILEPSEDAGLVRKFRNSYYYNIRFFIKYTILD